jgi:hypothetical protein
MRIIGVKLSKDLLAPRDRLPDAQRYTVITRNIKRQRETRRPYGRPKREGIERRRDCIGRHCLKQIPLTFVEMAFAFMTYGVASAHFKDANFIEAHAQNEPRPSHSPLYQL